MGSSVGMRPVWFLGVICILYTQTGLSVSDESRDYLFEKPWKFVKQRAGNKTRFTDEEKKLMLQIHNAYRSVVLPPAANMRELMWDNDLEEYAYNHTQRCTGAHSAGTMVKKWPGFTETWNYMGENLYYSYAPWYSFQEALWMFWAEGEKYDVLTRNCTHSQTCGHYRVLVTAISSRVGCAMNTCQNFSVSRYPTPAVFLSCSYNGRILVDDIPYVVGERGSDCTREKQGYEFQFQRHGLCVFPNLYYDNTGFDGNTSVVGVPSSYPTTTSTPTTTLSTSTRNASTDIVVTTAKEHSTTEISKTTPNQTYTRTTEAYTYPSSQSTTGSGQSSTTQTTITTTVHTQSPQNSTDLFSTTKRHPISTSPTSTTPSSNLSSQTTATEISTSSTSVKTKCTSLSTSDTKRTTTGNPTAPSTPSTEGSTQKVFLTSSPPTSTSRTSTKRSVSKATHFRVWNLQHLLLFIVVGKLLH